jgi:hypothetical protein
MKYADLLADLARRTRTVVQTGQDGVISVGSPIFRVPPTVAVAAEPSYWLRITSGDVQGIYPVAFAVQNEVRCAAPFYQDAQGLSWEILERGIPASDIKRLLDALPDAIMAMEVDDQVRTPLGTFKKVRKSRKRVKDPQGNWTHSPERIQARIRPGKRLQQELESPEDKRQLKLPDFDKYTLPYIPDED